MPLDCDAFGYIPRFASRFPKAARQPPAACQPPAPLGIAEEHLACRSSENENRFYSTRQSLLMGLSFDEKKKTHYESYMIVTKFWNIASRHANFHVNPHFFEINSRLSYQPPIFKINSHLFYQPPFIKMNSQLLYDPLYYNSISPPLSSTDFLQHTINK